MSSDRTSTVISEQHEPTLRISNVSKVFGDNQALDDVSFDIRPGSVHGLLGSNGSGKSTLIKILAGVIEADNGRIKSGGEWFDLASQTPKQAAELGLKFVHQQDSTFGDLTIAENLAIARGFERGTLGRVNWAAQRLHAQAVLDRFGIPATADTEVRELGAAMQMMVAIARALQDVEDDDSGVLVLDEPTASLPRHEVDLLLDSVSRLAASGQSIVLVTHRLPEVMAVCDYATVLRDGKRAADLVREELTHDRLVAEIMGRKLAEQLQPEVTRDSVNPGEEVLRLEAVKAGTYDIVGRAGEVIGLAGLLGSGRTSILKRIFGAAPRTKRVFIGDEPIASESPQAAMAAGIAYVPEDRSREAIFPDLSISQNISIAKPSASASFGRISSRRERAHARALLKRFAVKAASETLPLTSLSGGNQQKVILARWMQRDPKVLLLDEPTQGVDVGARAELHRLIRAAADQGAVVLVVSSEFEELVALCDRALVVQEGHIVDEVLGEDLTEDTLNSRVYAKEVSV